MWIFTFRVTDVDNLIANTAGALAGYAAARALTGNRTRPAAVCVSGGAQNTWELILILALAFAAPFFIQPYISEWIWSLAL